MANNLFLWNSAAAFGTGTQENLCVCDDALSLADADGRYFPAGCYTSPEMTCAPFTALVASWNSDTPVGTAVEVQVRVRTQGTWSPWLSYGKWSPFIARASAPAAAAQDAAVFIDTDTVRVAGQGADAFQLRAFLYSGQPHATPVLALLAASLQLSRSTALRGDALNRCVPVPSYSQSIREPRMASRMCSPTTITMLMNRYGEDVLPEEAALACYDSTYAGFGNWSFTTALAGCYGYEAYVCFCDLAALKNEIKHGFGCGASVRYTNHPTIAAEKGLPLVEGTSGTTEGHLLVVRGFAQEEDGTEYVLVNDSFASCDTAAQRRYRLDEFEAAWSGTAYFLHAKHPRATLCPPYRTGAELRRADLPGEYALYRKGERRSLPVHFTHQSDTCTGCVCYAVQEQHAYATTAHKCFFYAEVSENGNIALDTPNVPVGTKLTVFIIGHAGVSDVAELTV
ncbi:MAG: C39 family peptidase [Ruthenibacterium sp.]